MSVVRATFLTVMPVPYMQDLFAAMRSDGRIQPRVLYMEMSAPDTYWGDRALPEREEILPGRWFNFLGGRIHLNPTAVKKLGEDLGDITVIAGYSSLTAQVAVRWLTARNHPWVFFGERPQMRQRGWLGSGLRKLAMLPILRGADALAVVGNEAVEAYRKLKPQSSLIRSLPYYTDLTPFFTQPALPGTIPNRFRILFCGQLIERKGVDVLFDAFSKLAHRHNQCELHIVGEGPLRHTLMNNLPRSLHTKVHVHGFRPTAELPSFFASADVFVLPSRHDGWGVVVNQALASGLPVVASNAVGAAKDFVQGRENGIIVRAGSSEALLSAFERYANNPGLLRSHSEAAKRTSSELTLSSGVDHWVSFLLETLRRAESKRAPRRREIQCSFIE